MSETEQAAETTTTQNQPTQATNSPAQPRRVAVDAMGGDYAPAEVVRGAVAAAREYGAGIVLVGPEDAIRTELRALDTADLDIEVVHTDQVIGMDEHPAEAVRAKRRNSITLAHQMIKDGRAQAAVSAGNSGAVMAAAIFTLGRIRGIERPAFAGVLPAAGGAKTLVLDMGANTDSKPAYLVQFALMGSAYMQTAFGVARPRVGLLANGEEETKGDQLTQEAHKLLKAAAPAAGLHFIGNIEGRDINAGTVDVVVCDGFVGNVVLKTSEGLSKMLLEAIKRELMATTISKVGALLARSAFDRVRQQLDYEEYGGVPVLGVNGVSIISHGRSRAKAIKNAIRVGIQAADAHLPEAIADGLRRIEVGQASPPPSPVSTTTDTAP